MDDQKSQELTMADPENFAHLFSFAGSNKAGMEGSDKSNQTKVIYEMSKGTRFFSHASKQDNKRKEKIEKTKEKISCLTDSNIREMTPKLERDIIALESVRNVGRVCAVFDMDMFFAAVAIRDRPHLAESPVAVGGMGMISTTNYIARKFGVRSAMPGFIGKKLCPDLVFVPSEFDKYKEASAIVKGIISEYDPHLQSHSLDEFFVDLTDCATAKLRGPQSLSAAEYACDVDVFALRSAACDIATEIRSRIQLATGGLTSSAGIANNFMLAKIAADINKPNGQYSLPPSRAEILVFLETLPCRKVNGIGRVTEKVLSDLGVHTMGDVRRNLAQIVHGFTPSLAQFLMRAAVGISSEERSGAGYSPGGEGGGKRKRERAEGLPGRQKSIGVERTFAAMKEPHDLMDKLSNICHKVSSELQQKGVWAGTITLKLKTVDFELMTKRHTLDKITPSSSSHVAITQQRYVQSQEDIFEVASTLLRSCLPVHIRLIGVQASKLRLSPTGRVEAAVALKETPLGRLFHVGEKRHRRGDGSRSPSTSLSGGCDMPSVAAPEVESDCSKFGESEGSDSDSCALLLEESNPSHCSNDGQPQISTDSIARGNSREFATALEMETLILRDESSDLYAQSVSSKDEDESSSWGSEGGQEGSEWSSMIAGASAEENYHTGTHGQSLSSFTHSSAGQWSRSFTPSAWPITTSTSRCGVDNGSAAACHLTSPTGVTSQTRICSNIAPEHHAELMHEDLSCPVCGDRSSTNLAKLNAHLDSCLAMSSTKKRGIKDYFSSIHDPENKKNG